jgi:hypothetical protein
MSELQTGSTQGGHEHPTVELEHGQSSKGFCPRCPLSDQSANGVILQIPRPRLSDDTRQFCHPLRELWASAGCCYRPEKGERYENPFDRGSFRHRCQHWPR